LPAQAWMRLTVGFVAAVDVIITRHQKNNADRRSEWWRQHHMGFRTDVSDNDTEAGLGWKVLNTLAMSKLFYYEVIPTSCR
jgi:hypothetical protein